MELHKIYNAIVFQLYYTTQKKPMSEVLINT